MIGLPKAYTYTPPAESREKILYIQNKEEAEEGRKIKRKHEYVKKEYS